MCTGGEWAEVGRACFSAGEGKGEGRTGSQVCVPESRLGNTGLRSSTPEAPAFRSEDEGKGTIFLPSALVSALSHLMRRRLCSSGWHGVGAPQSRLCWLHAVCTHAHQSSRCSVKDPGDVGRGSLTHLTLLHISPNLLPSPVAEESRI